MKKMSIRAKMLLCILPVVAIAMILLTYIASNELANQIQVQSTEAMNATTIAAAKEMNGNLNLIKNSAVNIAAMVSTSYKLGDTQSFGTTISKIINENDSHISILYISAIILLEEFTKKIKYFFLIFAKFSIFVFDNSFFSDSFIE